MWYLYALTVPIISSIYSSRLLDLTIQRSTKILLTNMKFSFHLTLTCIVSMHYALAISVSSQKCNAFTKSGITGNSSVTLINSTLVAEKSLNISNTFNDFPFCRVIAKIAYGDNNTDTLNFEVWLPEPEDYNGRFMAVGKSYFLGKACYATLFEKTY